MKRVFFKFLLALMGFSLSFVSCISTVSETEEFSELKWTEETGIQNEIKSIRSIQEKEHLKALWLASLLKARNHQNQEVADVFSECEHICRDQLEILVEDEKLVEARKYLSSMIACGADDSRELEKRLSEIEKKIVDATPGLAKNPAGREKHTMAQAIDGTVTVFVDKGIKIQGSRGMLDGVIGSGFFISPDGYIVTNHHVISDMVDTKKEGYSRLYVKLVSDPDTRIPAKVVGYDSVLDMALLKAEIDAPYYFELGSSEGLSVGDKVYAIGSPLGLEKTLTSGIVSSVDRKLNTEGRVFQIDAAVNSGNSGGPLIDEDGKVQAIVFAGVANFQGLNFAIPVEYLISELPFLYSGGEKKHGWIGAYGKTKRLPGYGAREEGVELHYLMAGSCSLKSGMLESMTVTGINGKEIANLDQFNACLMSIMDGSVVRIRTVDSDGVEKEFPVYLETRPKYPGHEIYSRDLLARAMLPILGAELVSLRESGKKKFKVVRVLKASIADEMGFSENDPLDVISFRMRQGGEYAEVQIAGKKKNNGYMDVSVMFSIGMDSPFYF